MRKILILCLLVIVVLAPFTPVVRYASAAVCDLNLVFIGQEQGGVANSLVNYQLKVTNTGSGTCFSGYLSLYYSGNETFISSSPVPKAGNYFWLLGNIATGETKNIAITTKRNDSSPLHTEACATANNGTDTCKNPNFENIVVNPPVPPVEPPPVVPPVVPPVTPPAEPKEETDNLTDIPKIEGKESGIWVWESVSEMTEVRMNEVVLYAKQSGFNVIYLTIDDLLPTLLLPTGLEKTTKTNAYGALLVKFIKKANDAGLSVDAVAGWKDWSEPAHQHKALAMIDFVGSFNNTQPTKFRMMQFDVEPYLLARYERNKASVLTNLVSMTDKLQIQSASLGVPICMVIPHFYDATQNWTPSITFQGKKDYTFNHMLNILDKGAGNSLIIMSYRNYAIGGNGSVEISKKEILDADTSLGSTKVIIAQETGPVDPDFVTFYDTSREYMFSQINTLNETFKNNASFGGIAVNYLEPFSLLQ